MFYHKSEKHRLKFGLYYTLLVFLTACTQGLQGGAIKSSFSGIETATVLSPTTVELSWTNNSDCSAYRIFQLSATQQGSTSSYPQVTVPPFRITGAESERLYTFSIGCVSDNNVTGTSITTQATTWPIFSGTFSAAPQVDTTGGKALINLKWNYPYSGIFFNIYAKLSPSGGADLSTWKLVSDSSGVTLGAGESLICSTMGNSVKIGQGGDCNPNLQTGLTYDFKVVAQFPDGTYSTDTMGSGGIAAVPSAFAPPNCVLTQAGLGSDSSSSYLFLRCDASSATSGCALSDTSVHAYQIIGSTLISVSDSLTLSASGGSLKIQPDPANLAKQANDHVVQGLQIQYTCNSNKSVSIADYSGSKAPVLKYGRAGFVASPIEAIQQSPSFAGKSLAIGDFNCDGKPDLAVGLPNVTYNSAPYFSQYAETGAVKIYYDYTAQSDGSITSNNIQFITFRDLPANAHFGQSLSAGNINRDVYRDSATSNVYSCDDLIIGAPGDLTSGTLRTVNNTTTDTRVFSGASYIFYGQPEALPRPLDSQSLSVNTSSCSGILTSKVCSPVKLAPNDPFYGNVNPAFNNRTASSNLSLYGTGWAVSYIGDFNADGYGDVAIGNPNCSWDGDADNNSTIAGSPTGYSVFGGIMSGVGCVYVYWGGPNGLQNIYMGTFPDGAAYNAPYAKMYPPIPVANMHFGTSISNGAEVDGRLPVPVEQDSSHHIALVSGSDFAVSAPDFSYDPIGFYYNGTGKVKALAWTPTGTNVDPNLTQGGAYASSAGTIVNKIVAPLNNAWKSSAWTDGATMPTPTGGLNGSTGIVFLYSGRSALKSYNPTLGSAYHPFPLNISSDLRSSQSYVVNQLSSNIADRQNGSQAFTYNVNGDTLISPIDSFYNCATRGSPSSSRDSAGYYRHFSCLAGRNNFSLIYPILSGAETVNQFGLSIGIAGAKEQNAVALAQLQVPSAQYSLDQSDLSNLVLNTLTQGTSGLNSTPAGGTHDRIRGTSLWEIGVQTITAVQTSGAGNDTTSSPSVGSGLVTTSSAGISPLSRSILKETYSNLPSGMSANTAIANADINRDGYADVIVGTGLSAAGSAYLYTYFGNYAADFSYSSTLGSPGNCTVSRANAYSQTVSNHLPFATYNVASSADNFSATNYYTLTGEYPFSPAAAAPAAQPVPSLRFLGDTTTYTTGNISFAYAYGARSALPATASSCLPQRISYGSAVSNGNSTPGTTNAVPSGSSNSITVTDLDNDGLTDVLIGFSGDSPSGRGVGLYASNSGSSNSGWGLVSSVSFTTSGSKANMGSAVAATNWKFINETGRRDIFVGASGYAATPPGGSTSVPGTGALFYYGAPSTTYSAVNNLISSSTGAPILDFNNTPNGLGVQYSKIIGDVNGDGYDDILVPVKRVGSGGVVQFDAIIVYGSSFGPITYEFCSTNLSNGKITGATSCAASSVSQVATMGGATINLPQYINIPTGLPSYWAENVFAVGDVDRDGYSDIMVVMPGNAYVFFGSAAGLIVGPPSFGPSNNHSPQIITHNGGFLSGGSGAFGGPVATANGGAQAAHAFVHGDFNGDGFEDIAIGISNTTSPSRMGASSSLGVNAVPGVGEPADSLPWNCDASTSSCPLPSIGVQTSTGFSAGHGMVVILYGSPTGIQTPVNGSGVPQDFATSDEACPDYYGGGVSTGCSGLDSNLVNVYGSLTITGTNVSINTSNSNTSARPACSPQADSTMAATCKTTLVRNPLFLDSRTVYGAYTGIVSTTFATSLTVADVNGDGVDDLVVGAVGYSDNTYLTLSTGVGVSSDATGKGVAFIYYGAKGYGLVAPYADKYLNPNTAKGLNSSLDPITSPVFMLAPHFTTGVASRDPANEVSRGFSSNMTSGDFNGDGKDDLAISTSGGQVYIYYGPICGYDNSRVANANAIATENVALDISSTPTVCSVMDLSQGIPTAPQLAQAPRKALNFQTTYVSNYVRLNSIAGIGNVLTSKRPVRDSSGVVVKNPGNIDGDPDGTSDLVVGSASANDPNVSSVAGKNSGLAYVLFGHKASGSMSSKPGLYVGTPSYYTGFATSTSGSKTYYQYTPLILKPYPSDLSTGHFFYYEVLLGDVNGDGRADLLMNTDDIQTANDGSTPVIFGGGFKLFY